MHAEGHHPRNPLRRFAGRLAALAEPGRQPRTRHRVACYAAAGVVALVAAGCSSGPAGGTGPAAGGAAGGARETSITIALPVAEPVQSPVYLAAKLGYFAKQGINAHVVVLASDTAADAALVSGSIQFTSVNAVALLTAAGKGIPLQDICTEYNGPSWALVVSSAILAKTHVTAATPLKQLLEALRGTSVAIVGTAVSAPGLIFTGLLKEVGLPANTVNLVGVSSSPDLGSAYSHGEVGAVFDTQPVPDQLAQQFGGKVIYDTTELSALAQIPWEGLISTKSYLSGNATVAKEVCAAIGEANNYLLQNPSGAVSQLSGTFPSLSPALLKDAITSYKWAPNAGMTAAQWSSAATQLAKFGLISPVSSATLSGAYSTKYLPAG